MSSDPPELGKGLFGYRKSAVNQIISDRDIMLRQAEGRVRAAESKVHELEGELVSMRDRNARMDEQLERLRQQLDALAARGDLSPVEPAQAEPMPQEAEEWDEEPATAEAPYPQYEEAVPQAEAQLPATDEEWPAPDEGYEVASEPAEQPTGAIQEDEIPYGAEVRLGGDAPDLVTQSWMPAPPASPYEEEEQDEVAMAGETFDYDDYDAAEEPGYGEVGSSDAEPEAESPSPFTRFPFTAEPYDQEPAQSSSAETETYVDEPAPRVHAFDPEPSEHAASEPQVETPEPTPAPPPAASAVSPETANITNRFLTEELAGILAAAEESAARIVERARATTQRQIARSNRVWREVQSEVSRFASWRQEVEPIIRNVQAKVEGVRSEIEEVPERIRQALAPMADSISSIDADLAELAAASNPPLLLTPTGLESEESDSDAWSLDDEEEGSEDPYGVADSFRDGSGGGGPGHLHAG